MFNFPVALQMFSVRDFAKDDLKGTLKKIKAMGYDGVEFAGLYGHSFEDVKRMCKEIGLVPLSAHVPIAQLLVPGALENYRNLGCSYLGIPYVAPENFPGREKFDEFVDAVNVLGKKAKELGMTLCYHNHDTEFETVDGEYILDIFYREIPAGILSTEIDTCWASVGGVDPAEYIRKYTGRVEIVHLKDYVGSKTENMYQLIGIDDDKKQEAVEAFELRPVGYGKQNFPEILKASKEAGAKWVIVEQDMPSMGKDMMECAEMSINYLKSIY